MTDPGPLRRIAYAGYGRLLRRRVGRLPMPGHVAFIMDGNRRWARHNGYTDVRAGHRRGAEHLKAVLSWCADLRIHHITVWVASADNIRKRDADEVAYLMHLAETVFPERVAAGSRWRIRVVGQRDLLPGSTARALKEAEEATADVTAGDLTIAIGYGGRQEVTDAVRAALWEGRDIGRSLAEIAENFSEEDIARHLYAPGIPYPDLVVRTSGEQRMSDFLLWQSVKADLFFCDVYWPAFGYVDLLRLLRQYGSARAVASTSALPGTQRPLGRRRGRSSGPRSGP